MLASVESKRSVTLNKSYSTPFSFSGCLWFTYTVQIHTSHTRCCCFSGHQPYSAAYIKEYLLALTQYYLCNEVKQVVTIVTKIAQPLRSVSTAFWRKWAERTSERSQAQLRLAALSPERYKLVLHLGWQHFSSIMRLNVMQQAHPTSVPPFIKGLSKPLQFVLACITFACKKNK